MVSMILFIYWIVLVVVKKANCIGLTAYFSQDGLHGNLAIKESEGRITVETHFKVFRNISEQSWSWSIYEFPVNYENVNSDMRCNANQLGKKLYDLESIFGLLVLSDNETLVKQFDVSVLEDGINSLWGRSIVLYTSNSNKNICSSLMTNHTDYENIAEARFRKDLVGSIIFRSISSSDGHYSRTLIYTELSYAPSNTSNKSYKKVTSNSWKIFTTDVFDNNDDVQEVNCNNLQILFDPYNAGSSKSIGDLDIRLGKLQISSYNVLNKHKQSFVDKDLLLTLNDYSSSTRKLYIVVFDDTVPNKYVSCAKIRPINPKKLKVNINGSGLKGYIVWKQKSLFEPTYVNVSLGSVYINKRSWLEYARDLGSIFISELPPMPGLVGLPSYCTNRSTGAMFDPLKKLDVPLRGLGTQDEYSIGDLTGKLWNKETGKVIRIIQNSNELNGLYWDLFSPLIGVNSIFHRGLIVTRKQQNGYEPWTCAVILAYEPEKNENQVKMTTAVVTFKYPIVGQMLFRQPTNAYWEDTTIIIEYIIHADGGSLNTTHNHRWAIHNHLPGKDFYDWQNRCLSTGDIFNPYNLYSDLEDEKKTCSKDFNIACRTGDLYNNVGMLTISGSRKVNFLSRKLFTLSSLPLSGKNKILGRSVVVYDDFGPKARGDRLACSLIESEQPRKAVVKDWFGNGQLTNIMGKIEFTQQSQYDIINIEQALTGRSYNNLYSIHQVPVAISLEFPCEVSSIENIYNPLNVNSKNFQSGPGTLDFFELGDLSGKFSNIGVSEMKNETFSDNQMTLFGYQSVIGRSIIVSDRESTKHIACGTIERGYSAKESRESRAIVSFHHPNGFAYGYIRLSQLHGLTSGQSDTTIEFNLRYPGLHDRNKTRNHLFKIYVNPVGVDAIVKQTATRCTAGGYIWNPFYTQLADPLNDELYKYECSPDNPYRCYVGDVSARLGTIDIGYGRKFLTDSNFPLDGAVSSIGRSIVIFGSEKSSESFACANIEPDHDIIKYVNIERPPRFVTAQFLEDVREIMGVPKWFLEVDSRKTKLLYDNACVQIVIHFRGPIASRLDQDFSKMLISGRLDAPSLYIPGYQNSKRKSTIQHKECSIKDGNKNKRKNLKRKNTATSASGVFNTDNFVVVLGCLIVFYFKI